MRQFTKRSLRRKATNEWIKWVGYLRLQVTRRIKIGHMQGRNSRIQLLTFVTQWRVQTWTRKVQNKKGIRLQNWRNSWLMCTSFQRLTDELKQRQHILMAADQMRQVKQVEARAELIFIRFTKMNSMCLACLSFCRWIRFNKHYQMGKHYVLLRLEHSSTKSSFGYLQYKLCLRFTRRFDRVEWFQRAMTNLARCYQQMLSHTFKIWIQISAEAKMRQMFQLRVQARCMQIDEQHLYVRWWWWCCTTRHIKASRLTCAKRAATKNALIVASSWDYWYQYCAVKSWHVSAIKSLGARGHKDRKQMHLFNWHAHTLQGNRRACKLSRAARIVFVFTRRLLIGFWKIWTLVTANTSEGSKHTSGAS